MYEGQRDQLYAQQFNVEQTKFTVDSIKDTVSTVQAMTAASKEMKKNFKQTKELDINYIDKMNGKGLSSSRDFNFIFRGPISLQADHAGVAAP